MKIQEEAEEVVQEVFISIWTNRQRTALEYSFKTYISAALKYSIYARMATNSMFETIEVDHHLNDTLFHWST